YTLSVGNLGTHVVSPATYPNVQYNPLNDFEPVALLATTTYWLVARKEFPAKDLRDLIAYLKQNPDKVSAGMVGSGGLDQIVGRLFQKKTDTRFQFIPYRGAPPVVQDLVAGHVDIWFGGAFGALGQVKLGQLKAYAVFANDRWFAAPDVPSALEAGLPDFTVPFWIGLWAPKGTPKYVIAKLNAAVAAAAADETVRKRLRDQSTEPPASPPRTPEGFSALYKTPVAKWWAVIKPSA